MVTVIREGQRCEPHDAELVMCGGQTIARDEAASLGLIPYGNQMQGPLGSTTGEEIRWGGPSPFRLAVMLGPEIPSGMPNSYEFRYLDWQVSDI